VAPPVAPRGEGVSTGILAQDTTIAARDGHSLAATVFAPQAAPRGAVLINSATAVPRKIYRGFASFLAQQGFAVLTYDYRGTGGSRPASLRGFNVRMRDWAALDVSAAIAHMRQVWPRLPLNVVGHSFGGQAIGLVPNNTEIARVLLVASQAGYWGLLHSPEKYRVYLLLRLIGSPVARLLGYMPGRLGIGEDLPRDVFLEWTGWVMQRRYFFDDTTLQALENFPRYRGALRAICLTDDPWATAPAIDLLCAGFTGTAAERIDIRPESVGAAKIGHFGFFRPEHRDTLWRDAAKWLGSEQSTQHTQSSF
jgi:predicted alpha/beta hydrolase